MFTELGRVQVQISLAFLVSQVAASKVQYVKLATPGVSEISPCIVCLAECDRTGARRLTVVTAHAHKFAASEHVLVWRKQTSYSLLFGALELYDCMMPASQASVRCILV